MFDAAKSSFWISRLGWQLLGGADDDYDGDVGAAARLRTMMADLDVGVDQRDAIVASGRVNPPKGSVPRERRSRP
jgi:hypothetical protein